MAEYDTRGTHVMADFWGVDFDLLDDLDHLVELLSDSAHSAGATVLNHVHHKFQPQGVTIAVLLSESHATIHTYPDKGFAAIDIYTCGDHVDPHIAVDILEQMLNPSFVKIKTETRGVR